MKNNGYVYVDRVPRADEGLTVAVFYARHYGHSGEAAWRLKIEAGQIRLNGRPAAADDRLARNDRLEYQRPAWEEPDVPADFGVLYEDDSVLVLDKPSGLPVLPGGGFLENTLLSLARRRFGPACSPLHRLGRGTSGAILFTRDADTARSLVRAMEERRILKVYLALAAGDVRPDAFTIEAPIGPVPYGTSHMIHAFSPQGRPSTSHVRVIRRQPQANTSLLEVTIPTGRPHQIRIHLAYAGFPLAGDPLYAVGGLPLPPGGPDGRTARPGDLGYHLHSWKIRFPHPGLGEDVEVVSPPPPKLYPEPL